MKYNIPKGTKDILPSETVAWQTVETIFKQTCDLFGYQEIRLPTFEHTEVFTRGVGDTTDVVQKEMYTFPDKAGRSLTLRPEGTAGTVRSYIENGMSSKPSPVKLFYAINAFRYENVQKGRYREFHQFGVEAFGAKGPEIDGEIIALLVLFFQKLQLKSTHLCLNSIGCPQCRPAYHQKLKEYYKDFVEELCGDCQNRYQKNPLRLLDCKKEKCHQLAVKAPKQIDFLCQECQTHFNGLTGLLDHWGISYTIDPFIVRGLDYYSRTVFEFISENVGTQGTICGGGRYDGLVEILGGTSTPGIGFALGVERLLMEIQSQEAITFPIPTVQIYIATQNSETKQFASKVAFYLRKNNISCEFDLVDRSFKAQLKYANKQNIPFLLVIGEEELLQGGGKIKNMKTGQETDFDLKTLSFTELEKIIQRDR